MNPQYPATAVAAPPPPPSKKNVGSTIAAIVLFPCMIVAAAASLSFVTTRTQAPRPCDGSGSAKFDELGLKLPEGAIVCSMKTFDDRQASGGRTTSVDVLVAKRSLLCATTFGKFGCSSLVRAEIGFLAAMPEAGWQDISPPWSHEARPGEEGKYSNLKFQRADGTTASVMLSDDHGETSASVTVIEPSER